MYTADCVCDDVLMSDTASATQEVKQNCVRTSTTVIRETGVVMEAEQRRARRAPANICHIAPVPSNCLRRLDHVRPAKHILESRLQRNRGWPSARQ